MVVIEVMQAISNWFLTLIGLIILRTYYVFSQQEMQQLATEYVASEMDDRMSNINLKNKSALLPDNDR